MTRDWSPRAAEISRDRGGHIGSLLSRLYPPWQPGRSRLHLGRRDPRRLDPQPRRRAGIEDLHLVLAVHGPDDLAAGPRGWRQSGPSLPASRLPCRAGAGPTSLGARARRTTTWRRRRGGGRPGTGRARPLDATHPQTACGEVDLHALAASLLDVRILPRFGHRHQRRRRARRRSGAGSADRYPRAHRAQQLGHRLSAGRDLAHASRPARQRRRPRLVDAPHVRRADSLLARAAEPAKSCFHRSAHMKTCNSRY